MLDQAEAKLVCDSARAYLGVPWVRQGRSKAGLDCVGIPVMAYRDAGADIDEGPVDYRNVDPKRLMATLLRYFAPISPAHKAPADILVFSVLLGRETHLALLVDGPSRLNAIHCPLDGQVVEAGFDPRRGTIRGVYRWRLSSLHSPS